MPGKKDRDDVVHTSAQDRMPERPLSALTPDYPPDEYSGKGGDYVRDPETGIRKPAGKTDSSQ